ncbi:hypothetical protein DFH06DRAFT_1125532 [Mycena polygramma]|nr:hypothetical protein DFH06DRAFT_1125532 [Mycena polygramma]
MLSPEIVMEILDLLTVPLAFPTDDFPDHETLLSCSLVCKSWSTHSQRLLFRRAIIDNEWAGLNIVRGVPMLPRSSDKIACFSRIIAGHSAKSRWLARNVHSLVLRPHSSTKPDLIVAILARLPNLWELDITGATYKFRDAEFLQLQNSEPSIRSLRINADRRKCDFAHSIGGPDWQDIVRLIAALPTIRLLDITANTFDTIPDVPTPLGLGLLAFRFKSKTVDDTSKFLASLTRGCKDGANLQVYYHALDGPPANLDVVLSGCGHHLRSLFVPEELEDPHVLSLCTQLERFECGILPSDDLVAAIPRNITALAVTNPTISYTSVQYLTQQLATFPNLRIFTWVGLAHHPGLAALRGRCAVLGIELRLRALDSVSDDGVLFALRRRLLRK